VPEETVVATPADLARLGFADASRAHRLLSLPPVGGLGSADPVVTAMATAADPDRALLGLIRLLEASADPASLLRALQEDPDLSQRLTAVLGSSIALADHLVRHPDHWQVLSGSALPDSRPTAVALRAELLMAVGAAPDAPEPVATMAEPLALDALRAAYRRALLSVAARDLCSGLAVDDVAAELSDLAAAALEAGLAIARTGLPSDSEPVRLAVIGMGKLGGHELNYVSDVDVVYVAECEKGGDEAAALRTANLLAAGLSRACSAVTAEGSLWEIDAGLRPEGRAGPLVRTLASHVAYYERWAKTWEFQALLKARPVAGDLALGRAYGEAVAARAWQAAASPGFVDDVQSMRRRVEDHIPAKDAERELKLGPGGLRDVEFSVQLLQLVHGRSDPSLRLPSTLAALSTLAAGGYVGREDAATLDSAYRFLRTLEHRLQLTRLRRTHVVPRDPGELRSLGRSMGLRSEPDVQLTEQWRQHAREARRLHEKLFYRPLLQAVARLEPGEARLTPEAARARLEALGYADPAGALRHLEALTSGVSRRAAIQRTLLPVMLGWFADAADPDSGLLAFRQVSDALGSTHWYLALLRDAGAAAERLARVLASSRYAADLLQRAPEAVAMLADDDELRPRTREVLQGEVLATVARSDDPEAAAVAVRAIRRRELFRVAAADILGLIDVEQVGEALWALTAAALAGGLAASVTAVEREHGPLGTRFAVIAMGRLGGHELGYGSDADVMFVHQPIQEGGDDRLATDTAHAVANELRRLLSLPAADPPLVVDADLRPEGRQGPLVRSLASYAAYYARWSVVWESQALLRAEPIAGDLRLGREFTQLVAPVRWPPQGLSESEVREIRRLKARVEAERLPRGADPATHTKLGPGGLADIEWTVQLLQLQYAGPVPSLRTTRTIASLAAAVEAELISAADAAVLTLAWRHAAQIRNATTLVRGRSEDNLPRDLRDAAGVARLVGYPPGHGAQLSEDYRRDARRARAVVKRVFYG
jgi:glutamate-ammonia-ligase adenylyltransferase